MKSFIKCELCNVQISEEKCVFATIKVTIDDKEHYFCCAQHAEGFTSDHQKPKKTSTK
ncbi:MAG: hypothetical protein V1915_02615 [Candidatus Bathyarchaeota archaeon]